MSSAATPNIVTNFADLDPEGSYTYTDYLLWHFQERVELIKGRIFRMSPAPNMAHQRASQALNFALLSFFRQRSCQVFVAPFDGAPDWVIEILSPGNSRMEMREKFRVYEEAGVREYWIVNPAEKVVIQFVLNAQGQFYGLAPAIEDDQLTPHIFPELVVDLKEVFS